MIDGPLPRCGQPCLSHSLVHTLTLSLLVKDGCNPPWSYASSSTSSLLFAPASLPGSELFCRLRLSLPRGQPWPWPCCLLPRPLHVPPRRARRRLLSPRHSGPRLLALLAAAMVLCGLRTDGSVRRLSNWDSHFFPSPGQLVRPVSAKPESSFQKEALAPAACVVSDLSFNSRCAYIYCFSEMAGISFLYLCVSQFAAVFEIASRKYMMNELMNSHMLSLCGVRLNGVDICEACRHRRFVLDTRKNV